MKTTPELELISADLQDLARQHGWAAVMEGTARWRDPQSSQELVVAAAEDADLSALEPWLKSRAPGWLFRIVPLAAETKPVAAAGRILIALTAGRLLQSGEVDDVNAAMAGRTLDDACIVFTRSERVGNAEELEKLERGAWRLLVPEPRPDRNNQSLGEQSIFLWGNANGGFLRARLEADSTSLAGWAGKGVTVHGLPDGASGARQLLALIDQAQACLPHCAAVPSTGGSAPTSGDVNSARVTLDELERRLQRRMEEDLEAILRQENVSLDTLEQDLSQGIAVRTLSLSDRLGTPPKKFAETNLHPFIMETIARWEQANLQKLETLSVQLEAETRTLFRSVDWAAVSQAIGPTGDTETVASQLAGQTSGGKPLLPSQEIPPNNVASNRNWLSNLPEGANRRGVLALPVVILAALSGGVAAWFVGLPIISVALAGGAGIWVGASAAGTLAANKPDTAQILARQFVHEHIAEAKQYIAVQLRERFASGKKIWHQEIERLKGLMDLPASAAATSASHRQSEAQAHLDELRNRIMQTVTQQGFFSSKPQPSERKSKHET